MTVAQRAGCDHDSGFAYDDFRKTPSYTGGLKTPPAAAMHANTPIVAMMNDAVHTRLPPLLKMVEGATKAGTIGQRKCIKRLTSPLNCGNPLLTCGTQAGAKLQTC